MKTILYRVTRLLHPITLAVILVGIAGFLLGLMVAVDRQDAAFVTPVAEIGDTERIARLASELAGRDAELAELRSELTRQRSDPPALPANDGAENAIASLEAELADALTELKELQSELTKLSGQLAEAIQSRDELRAQNERARLVAKNESVNLEQTIAVLRRELKAAQQSAPPQAPVAAVREDSAPATPPVEEAKPAAAEPPAPAKVTTPVESPRADAKNPEPKAVGVTAPAGPITQGVAAYQDADYDKAYALWLPPALKGSTRAQFYVGALYFEGRGVPADRVQSYMWLRTATQKDDPGAIKLLDRVREGMTGAELAEVETRIANGETIPER